MKAGENKNESREKTFREKIPALSLGTEREKLMTLADMAKQSPFSKSYLAAAARDGKIRAVKSRDVWYTTRKWLDEFVKEMEDKKNEYRSALSKKIENTREEKETSLLEMGILEFIKREGSNRKTEKKESEGVAEKTGREKSMARKFIPFLFRNGFVVMTTLFTLAAISFVSDNMQTKKTGTGVFVVNDSSSQGTVMGEQDPSGLSKDADVYSSEHFVFSQVTFGGDIAVAKEEEGDLAISDIKSELVSSKSQGDIRLLVSWKTSKPADCETEYEKNGEQNGKVKKEDQYSFAHSAVFPNLDPATAYNFVIRAKDKWGNTKTSDKFAFYTGAPDVSMMELLTNAARDAFGWAMRK